MFGKCGEKQDINELKFILNYMISNFKYKIKKIESF